MLRLSVLRVFGIPVGWRIIAGLAVMALSGMAGLPAGLAAEPCEHRFAPPHGLQAPQPAAGFSKSRAILGGAPSQLDLIRAKQVMGSAAVGDLAPASEIIVRPLAIPSATLPPLMGMAEPFANTMEGILPFFLDQAKLPSLPLATAANPIHLPTSISGPSVLTGLNQGRVQAFFGVMTLEEDAGIQRTDSIGQSMGSRPPCMRPPGLASDSTRRSPPRERVRQGYPDIFGTVALSVSRTALDGKWRRAATAALEGRAGPWQELVTQNRRLDRAAQVRNVNAWVNARIAYTEDLRQYGTADHWASAAQSLTTGRGDCEDYAIAKMQILRALGIAPDSMYLVITRDLVRRADHAVLALELDGELLVLDNETDQILRSNEIRDYRPVLSFNGAKRWTHGYRTRPAMASLRLAALAR